MRLPVELILVTFLGTLSVYAMDRWLERVSGHVLASRHQVNLLGLGTILCSFAVALVMFLFQASNQEWLWLIFLGVGGSSYLLISAGWIRSWVFMKELLGAAVFSWLVLGLIPVNPGLLAAFSALGFSNFLWSGYFDRVRDEENQILSVASWNPALSLLLARLSAIIAIILFSIDGLTFLAAASALHAFWPKSQQKVDWAFSPVILWCLSVLYQRI